MNDDPVQHRSIHHTISRRTFIGLLLSLAGWLAACRRKVVGPAATPTPMVTPLPTHTPPHTPTMVASTATSMPTTVASTATPVPPTTTPLPVLATVASTATPAVVATGIVPMQVALDRTALMGHWPATETSRVVLVRHGGVWIDGTPDPQVVLHMLDAGLSTLTGVPDVLAIWRALFDPGERVLLKVNCIASGGPTQPAVTYAVVQRLQEAGLPAENLLIFDRTDHELDAAGYTLNDSGSGVQCHGAQGKGTEIALTQARVRFWGEFDAYDAIVNLPTPKQHGGAGVSVSLKNHYGSVDRPGALHGNWCDPAIAELNAQPNIRDKTRLIVGAALNVSPRDWNRPERENALLLSFDPVALDTVARDILVRHCQELGLATGSLIDGARHLRTAQSLELGATDAERIDLREVILA